MEYGVESDNEIEYGVESDGETMEYGVESDNEMEYGVENDNEMEYGVESESDEEAKMTAAPRTSAITHDGSQPRSSPQPSAVQMSSQNGRASPNLQIPHPTVSHNPSSPSYERSISERPGPQYSVIKMSAARHPRRGPPQLSATLDQPFHPLSTTRRSSARQGSIYPRPGDFWAREPGSTSPRPSTLTSYERETTRQWGDANPTSTSSGASAAS